MKSVMYGIAGAVGVAAILVTVMMMVNSPSDMKIQIASQIEKATYHTIDAAAKAPVTAIDKNTGVIYALYAKDEGGMRNMYLIKSTDGGLTFSDPVQVNDVPGTIPAFEVQDQLEIGPNGELYVLYCEGKPLQIFENGGPVVPVMRLTRSLDGGDTFEPSVEIASGDGTPGADSYFAMEVSKENHIYISYMNSNNYAYAAAVDKKEQVNFPSTFQMLTSTDGGRTWNEASVIDSDPCVCCSAEMAVGNDGEVYVAWRHAAIQTKQLRDTGDVRYWHDNGTNTWNYDYASNYEVIRDMVVAHSNDGGEASSFTTPVPMHADNWFMNGCPDAGSGLAFDSRGRMHVSWFTGSETAAEGSGFYYAYSDDQGKTFSTPIPLHLLSTFWIPPTTQQIAIDDHDNAWIIFVNSEGIENTNPEGWGLEGNGTIQLAVVDKDGKLVMNRTFGAGEIPKHYPGIASGSGLMSVSWQDGSDAKIAVMTSTT